ncbi:MAG TPA: NAD(P)H-dependent glycerol-3-phosphate dehydrogenase [Dehalococcoidia bacterium]|nr:NAD(P)H-dependent glycerol-3-phosphate dehydrogenase [Dehalococcoidia bacterium]
MGEVVAVLGAGAFGTALAQAAAHAGHQVRLWSIEAPVLAEIRQRRRNSHYLPGVRLHRRIQPCEGLTEAVAGASLVLVAVPSRAVRDVARQLARTVSPGQAVANAAKGLEEGTSLRMSQVLEQELPVAVRGSIATVGGPAIAREMARRRPTALVAAAREPEVAELVQGCLQNAWVRVAVSPDVVGVEVAATLKNAYAIALGLCDGLGMGANVKATLTATCLAEMAEVVVCLGGHRDTAYGLAGLGDLLATGYSPHSRNRTLGEKIGRGEDWRHFLASNTVEGPAAVEACLRLVRPLGLPLPVLTGLHALLFLGADPMATLMALLEGAPPLPSWGSQPR